MCSSLESLESMMRTVVFIRTLDKRVKVEDINLDSEVAFAEARATISNYMVDSLTGPESTKKADIKSAAELVALAESMKIDTADAKTKLANLINNQLESILKKYS